jgi:hypothetical protein
MGTVALKHHSARPHCYSVHWEERRAKAALSKNFGGEDDIKRSPPPILIWPKVPSWPIYDTPLTKKATAQSYAFAQGLFLMLQHTVIENDTPLTSKANGRSPPRGCALSMDRLFIFQSTIEEVCNHEVLYDCSRRC